MAECRVDFGAFAVDGDAVVLDVDDELREHRAEQVAADVVRDAVVELDGVGEQVDVCKHEFGPVVKAFASARELLLEYGLLEGNLFESFAEFGCGDASVGGKLDQTVFLRFLFDEFGAKALLDRAVSRVELVEGLGNLGANRVERVGSESFDRDGACHGCFEIIHPNGTESAPLALLAGADPVLVDAAVAGALAVDEAPLPSLVGAAAAVHHSLQVVEVHEIAVAFAVAAAQDLLACQKRLLADDRLVSTGIDLAFEASDARVVRVPEQSRERARGERVGGTLVRGPGLEALIIEHGCELPDGVLVRRVLLEGPGNERCPLWVDGDRVDESAVEVLADVEVPELCPADAPAAFDLVAKLRLDVFAVLANLHLVHDVGDGFHGVGHVAFAEFFLRRDQPDPLLEQHPLGDGGIGEVSEDA